jgi:hypothetical protein
MATLTTITLPGGIKSPAFSVGARFGAPVPDVFNSFAFFSDLVLEASEAAARLRSPASWDPALAGIAAEDASAYEAACFGAKEVLRMCAGDAAERALQRAAGFSLWCLQLEGPAMQFALAFQRPVFLRADGTGRILRAAEMIDHMMRRLEYLCAVMAEGSAPADVIADAALLPASCSLPYEALDDEAAVDGDWGDLDQEAQAF